MNEIEMLKYEIKWRNKLCVIFFVLGCFCAAVSVWAKHERDEIKRELAESNRLVGEYRERDSEVTRINRELASRNRRLAEGIGSIREIADSAGGNIRQAIGIIAGVKSVIETLEDSGALGSAGGVSSGSP